MSSISHSPRNIFLLLFTLLQGTLFAQQQKFDLVSFNQPSGWKKQTSASALQFSKENTDGAYCLITVFKSLPGTKNAKENFDAAWETVVKEMVKTSSAPDMQPSAKEDGWEALSGYAPFEADGQKGLALLVTSTGYDRMVNILILTNSNSFETEMGSFLESMSFSKPTGNNNTASNAGSKTGNPVVNNNTNNNPTKAISNGFAFNTTNFDDGWTSTVQEDWVEVTKGSLKVLLHYPKEGTIFPADPEPLTVAAWNILVAPRYSSLKNFRTTYITEYNRPYLGMGTVTDARTGKSLYVVLFRQGETGWLEFICPDKNSFIREYKFDPETIRWDSESSLMNALSRMVNYNKFAVAASDFKGAWTSDFTGVQQLYHVYTGNYAGMNINQSSQTFQFGPGNSYSWKILSVNGMVGNMKYAQAKSAGKFSVPNNWQLYLTDIEGKPKTYHAHFSCIKGARILKLLDANAPGSGIYTMFGMQK